MLVLEDIVKSYGYFDAADHLSLNIGGGQVYGLAGARGSGKSTVMKIAAGVLAPDSGRVLLDGVPMTEDPRGARQKIGYVPEKFGFYERLTVKEYMDFYCDLYGISSEDRRDLTGKLLELAGLAEYRDADSSSLPRNRKKWLCLVRSLINDPGLLIWDEPAADLGGQEWKEVSEMIGSLRNMGKTIVISSGLLSGLAGLCDSVIVLDHGRVALEGTYDEISGNMDVIRRIL